MIRKTLICVIFLTFFNSSSNSIAATEIIVDEAVNQLIKNLGNVETATKGKKLKQFFAGNSLRLSFNGKIKEFKFNEDKYEVFENEKSIEIGKWKVSGILKNQIKLTPNNKSKPYFLKKINNKEIIYHFNGTPGKEGIVKTLVKIEPLIKEKTEVAEKKEEPKKVETEVAEKKEEPKKAETKETEKIEEPKIEKPKKEELKKIVKDEKVPEGKKRILKYVCDPNKSEYYWGKNKNNMKLSRYEDAPYETWQRSRGYGELEGTGELWSVKEIDFYKGYIYYSGSMQYDANSNGKLDTVPYAHRFKIKSFDISKGTMITESEYHLDGNPYTEIFTYEIEFDEFTFTTTMENTFLPTMNAGPKYWEKYINQCISTEYFVDKNSGERLIEFYNKQKPLEKKAHESLFGSSLQNAYQAQTDDLFKDINEQIANEINIIGDEYKNISKNINQNKNLKNESQKFVKEVSKDQLKEYKATSVITYYFFESQANYLASLELLYRAYDKNVEADKMKAQIIYLKDSKSSESKRLKSTTQILDQASKDIKNNINDKNKNLSDGSKILYQESLPFAFKATEYGYKVFVLSTTIGKEISNSNDKIGSILVNFNEVIGFASIIPKIPNYVKAVGSTSKLIFTGAKAKKIKDEQNLGDALDELDLSA